MDIFLCVLCLFAVFAMIVFGPVLFHWRKEISAKRRLWERMGRLDDFYKSKLQIVERPLGVGPDPNSDIEFCDAHKNQKFAVTSIMLFLQHGI